MGSKVHRRVPRLRDLRLSSLPARLPVFPLSGALLLPRGRLPLNIFEPRYVSLLEDALAGDRLFGMIQPSDLAPDEEDEEDRLVTAATGAPPPLFRVGCVGRLGSFTEREDGTFAITLAGLARFRVAAELDGPHAYRVLSVNYDDFAADLDPPAPFVFDRDALLDALRRYFQHRGFEARWDAIEQMDDDTLLTTLSMICPFPPAEKQALLEAGTLPERARTLQALLEMGGHEDDGNDGRPHAV